MPPRSDGPTLPPRETPAPHTAWEHYELGCSYLRSGDYARAEEAFRRSIELQPGEFWPYFDRAVCAYRLGNYRDAAALLDTCVALAPRSAECYYNRALAHEALGRIEDAFADDSRALGLNPRFTDAALNRGILARKLGRYRDALDDFGRARATAAGPRTLGLVAYNAALVHIDLNDPPAARAALVEAIAHGNDDARRLDARLRAK